MKIETTACDICGTPYDATKEADEPMHRIGFVDPPLMDPQQEASLDTELKMIEREAANPKTTDGAKAYYTERAERLRSEAEKRRAIRPEDRVEVDLVCHACFVKVRDFIKGLKDRPPRSQPRPSRQRRTAS